MKASEIIKKLEAMIEVYGDVPVECNEPDKSSDVEVTHIEAWGGDQNFATTDNKAVSFHIS